MPPRPHFGTDMQPEASRGRVGVRSPRKPQSKKKRPAGRTASPEQWRPLEQEVIDLNVSEPSLSDTSSRGRTNTRLNTAPERSIQERTHGTPTTPTRGRNQESSPAHASNADSSTSTSKTQDIDYFFSRGDKKISGSKTICLTCRYVNCSSATFMWTSGISHTFGGFV